MANHPAQQKGVNLAPKTDAEALALLRWMYGQQIPAFTGDATHSVETGAEIISDVG